jgi:DNA-binding NarL/FixJ family response regulator
MHQIYLVTQEPFLRALLAQIIRTEGQEMLHVVGASGWDLAEIFAIEFAQPDVVVAVVGSRIRSELQALAVIRQDVPGCQVLVIDTLADAHTRVTGDWGEADILLFPEQVLSSLVPAICCLTTATAVRA